MTYRNKDELAKLCISECASLKMGIKKMDSLRRNVILIVGKDDTLTGILTDGDVRRAILNGADLTEPLTKFVNKKPISLNFEQANEESSKTTILTKNIRHLPILERGILRDIVFDSDLQKEKEFIRQRKDKLDNPVVIMAGGRGTRLKPFTQILPKPLLPIGDKTVLEIIIERFLSYQVEEFYLTVNYKSVAIKAYFEELNPSYKLHYVDEKKPLGTAGSLKYLESKFDVPILVTNCDILVDVIYSDLVRHHNEKGYDITMVASLRHYNIPYGICEIIDGGELKEIKEKPEYSFLVNTGMYVVNPSVLSLIPKDTFYHITHLMDKVKQNGGKVGLYPISGNDWLDIGEWEEYKNIEGKIKSFTNKMLDANVFIEECHD